MIFEIRRAQNGHVLKVMNGGDNPEQPNNEVVYQEKYDDEV